jgi:hypothetical protein
MRYGTTLVLAVVVVLAAALIWTYRDQLTGEPKPPEKPAETLPLVEGMRIEDVASATLEETSADGRVTTKWALKKSDDAWRLTAPVEFAADPYAVAWLLRAAVEARYRQALEVGGKNQPTLAALGLAPPAFRLTLTTEAADRYLARTVALEIGRRSAFGEDLYVHLAEEARPGAETAKVVVLETADLLEEVRQPIEAYRLRELVNLGQDDLVRIDLDGEKGKARLDRSETNAGRWGLSEPLAARADAETASSLVRAALGARAETFVADHPEDLSLYGLAPPRLTLVLWKKGLEAPKTEPATGKEGKPAKPEPIEAATLRFGAWADLRHEKVYALSSDGKTVVTVDAATWKDLDKGAQDLRDRRVVAIEPRLAARIHVRVPARLTAGGADVAYDLAKGEGETWTLLVPARPEAKADAEAVEALLGEVADLKVLYFAEGENQRLAEKFAADGSIRIQLENEPSMRGFEIGKAPEAPLLVKNLQEDWVGRANEKDLNQLRQDWLAYLDKTVFAFDPKEATRITVRTPARSFALEKKDGAWHAIQTRSFAIEKEDSAWHAIRPTDLKPAADFAVDLVKEIQNLRCSAFRAATKNFKPYNLRTGDITVTVTLAPPQEGAAPREQTFYLAHDDKGKVVGRIEGGDLVFEVSEDLFRLLSGHPLPESPSTAPAEAEPADDD